MTDEHLLIIDGAYLYKSADSKFDYIEFIETLQDITKKEFTDKHYFNSIGVGDAKKKQNIFNSWLSKTPPNGPGFTTNISNLKLFRVNCHSCGENINKFVQKGVDSAIVLTVMKAVLSGNVKSITICAGDVYFVDLLKEIINNNIILNIVGFRKSLSPEIVKFGRVILIDEFADEIAK